MKNTDLTLMKIMDRFSTEEAAREYFENIRWANGPICPHCGNVDQKRIYKIAANPAKKIRNGLYKCAECGEQFSVTVGTVMEDTHIPLGKWLIAFYMICASKTQISALQLQRQLALGSYRTAWHLCHRIRYALMESGPIDILNGTVEADETYIGGRVKGKGRRYTGNKTAVVSLVERGGKVRQHIMPAAHLNTDESPLYKKLGKDFASHETVNHSVEEYVRHNKKTGRTATTNTVEGFFGNSKRSLDGTHHHVSGRHLPLYLAELDHKYNTRKISDGARTVVGIRGIEGKRLRYRDS